MSPKSVRQSVSSRLCSLLRRQKRDYLSTSCRRKTSVKIQITMTKKRRRRQLAAATMKKRIIKQKSALAIKKKAALLKLKAETIVVIPIRTKDLIDRGRNPSLIYSPPYFLLPFLSYITGLPSLASRHLPFSFLDRQVVMKAETAYSCDFWTYPRIFLTTLNPLCFRASYASEHVNGGKFEETKKNVIREGKGG